MTFWLFYTCDLANKFIIPSFLRKAGWNDPGEGRHSLIGVKGYVPLNRV